MNELIEQTQQGYRDLLIGKTTPKNAREKLIFKAGHDPRIAINILANIEKEHPLAQEIFTYYQRQLDNATPSIIRREVDF